jgi:hypothetical protein
MSAPPSESPQQIVQAAQSTISKLQMTYRDTDLRFWALAAAWHALRFAWYVAAGDRDSANDKFAQLVDAITDYRRWSGTSQTGG